jgi:hypothetical protein
MQREQNSSPVSYGGKNAFPEISFLLFSLPFLVLFNGPNINIVTFLECLVKIACLEAFYIAFSVSSLFA